MLTCICSALSNAINSNVNDVQNELVDLRDNFLRLEESKSLAHCVAGHS